MMTRSAGHGTAIDSDVPTGGTTLSTTDEDLDRLLEKTAPWFEGLEEFSEEAKGGYGRELDWTDLTDILGPGPDDPDRDRRSL